MTPSAVSSFSGNRRLSSDPLMTVIGNTSICYGGCRLNYSLVNNRVISYQDQFAPISKTFECKKGAVANKDYKLNCENKCGTDNFCTADGKYCDNSTTTCKDYFIMGCSNTDAATPENYIQTLTCPVFISRPFCSINGRNNCTVISYDKLRTVCECNSFVDDFNSLERRRLLTSTPSGALIVTHKSISTRISPQLVTLSTHAPTARPTSTDDSMLGLSSGSWTAIYVLVPITTILIAIMFYVIQNKRAKALKLVYLGGKLGAVNKFAKPGSGDLSSISIERNPHQAKFDKLYELQVQIYDLLSSQAAIRHDLGVGVSNHIVSALQNIEFIDENVSSDKELAYLQRLMRTLNGIKLNLEYQTIVLHNIANSNRINDVEFLMTLLEDNNEESNPNSNSDKSYLKSKYKFTSKFNYKSQKSYTNPDEEEEEESGLEYYDVLDRLSNLSSSTTTSIINKHLGLQSQQQQQQQQQQSANRRARSYFNIKRLGSSDSRSTSKGEYQRKISLSSRQMRAQSASPPPNGGKREAKLEGGGSSGRGMIRSDSMSSLGITFAF